MTAPEIYEQFASVHLAGSLEAAVYETLAAVPSQDWTATELAVRLRADTGLVHVALRQFAAAGIVDAFPTGPDVRYRWRSTRLFLGDQPAPDAFRDVVCGMWVRAATPFTIDTASGTQYFCSQRCMSRWQRRAGFATPTRGLARLRREEGKTR